MSDLSIVVPVLNRPDLLWKFWSTLPRQSGDVEFVFVDNGSAEPTKAMLDRIKNGRADVKVVTNEANLGFAKANNLGVAASTAPVLCLTQTDVVVNDDLVAISRGITEGSLYGPDFVGYDSGWNTFYGVIHKYLVGWMLFATRRTWAILGGFDERYFPADMEDVDLSTEAIRRGVALCTLNLASMHPVPGQGGWSQLPDRQAITLLNKELFREKWYGKT